MLESNESLRHRVYFAARDGLAMTLYALLSEINKEDVNSVLNEVKIIKIISFDHVPLFYKINKEMTVTWWSVVSPSYKYLNLASKIIHHLFFGILIPIVS